MAQRGPAYNAYQILHLSFRIAPILFGLDKFFNFITDWTKYTGHARLGSWVVAFWLWGIIANLVLLRGHYDVALRDFGLSLGALALAQLSRVYAVGQRRVSEPLGSLLSAHSCGDTQSCCTPAGRHWAPHA